MNCKECYHFDRRGTKFDYCADCEASQAEGEWIWEIDTGTRLIKCPKCGGRLSLGHYQTRNNYSFCPYCGKDNRKQQLSFFSENGCYFTLVATPGKK